MRTLILLLLITGLLAGCKKKDDFDPDTQLFIDIEKIEQYLADNNLTAEKHPTGVYYIVEEEGTGDHFPTASSIIVIAYEGYLIDGTVFDSADTANPLTSSLSQLIFGWQIGIPNYKKGGKGKLLIPSGYGYGNVQNGNIPPNSVLIFDIHLLDY